MTLVFLDSQGFAVLSGRLFLCLLCQIAPHNTEGIHATAAQLSLLFLQLFENLHFLFSPLAFAVLPWYNPKCTYELIKKIVESYPDNEQEANNHAQHHTTKE